MGSLPEIQLQPITDQRERQKPPSLPENPPPATRQTVLLLDDDLTVRESLQRVLRAAQLEVIATAGGDEALKYLLKPEVALVITDLRMAPIDGWDFLFHCRIGRPSLPVFVVSGVPLQSCGGADRLATAYFQKPVNLDTLLEAVQSRLQRSLFP
jgi:DNA-binding NtrC family response regulator